MIMADLNEEWDAWTIIPGATPSLQQHIDSTNALGTMHAAFMKNSELLSKPPFSYLYVSDPLHIPPLIGACTLLLSHQTPLYRRVAIPELTQKTN